jgi:hypothetical protein
LFVVAIITLMITDPVSARPQLAQNGTGFTYQGKLLDGGVPANGAYDLQFKLFDALSGGSQVGSTLTQPSVTVTNGLFTVQLDFGNVFNGTALHLEIGVRPGGSSGAYTTLSPRQPLSPTPYTLYSTQAGNTGMLNTQPASYYLNASNINTGTLSTTYFSAYADLVAEGYLGNAASNLALNNGILQATLNSDLLDGFHAGNASGAIPINNGSINTTLNADQLDGQHNTYYQNASNINSGTLSTNYFSAYADLVAESNIGTGSGQVAVGDHNHWGQTWSGSGTGLTLSGGAIGLSGSGGTYGVSGSSTNGYGVTGSSTNYYGVYGSGYDGVYGYSSTANGSGVYGSSTNTGGNGVSGSGSKYGVSGSSTNGDGVHGNSTNGTAISGFTINGTGIYGSGYNGVTGYSNTTGGIGVYGDAYGDSGNFAGYFNGNVVVNGNQTVTGTKSAVVKTQDYGTRTLYAVESPENWFQDFGTGQLTNGKAVITIDPVFAETVNLANDYHVFFTPMGDCALYVTDKTPTSFTVKALGGQTCSIAFDYNIVAKRLGYENIRLAVFDAALAEGTPNK